MKLISYQREIPAVIEKGFDGNDVIVKESYLQNESLHFTDENKEIQTSDALKHSYNGEYIIEDDGTPEPEPEKPSQLDRVEAQATYTAMMTDTLLEG